MTIEVSSPNNSTTSAEPFYNEALDSRYIDGALKLSIEVLTIALFADGILANFLVFLVAKRFVLVEKKIGELQLTTTTIKNIIETTDICVEIYIFTFCYFLNEIIFSENFLKYKR